MNLDDWRKGGFKLCANEGEATRRYFDLMNAGRKEDALKAHDEDRYLFVHNFGVLLRQTDTNIFSLEWDAATDTVKIEYTNEATKVVNVTMDNYIAIMRDVLRQI